MFSSLKQIFFSQNDSYGLLQQFTNSFLSNSIIIILILEKQCIPRSCNYPAAINETHVLALLHYISLLMWRVILMVKYVLTMLNIWFTKNNAKLYNQPQNLI